LVHIANIGQSIATNKCRLVPGFLILLWSELRVSLIKSNPVPDGICKVSWKLTCLISDEPKGDVVPAEKAAKLRIREPKAGKLLCWGIPF